MRELFLEGDITFQPLGMDDVDVPLILNKTKKIFKETIEFLFDVTIQESELKENGNFQGTYIFEENSSKEPKRRVIFSLYGLYAATFYKRRNRRIINKV